MSELDRFDKEAAEMLPCWYRPADYCTELPGCASPCWACQYRPAVADRLRADGAEIERLKESESNADVLREIIDKYDRDLRVKRIEADNLGSELAQLRAEIERLRAEIVYERERNANNVSIAEAELAQLRAKLELLGAGERQASDAFWAMCCAVDGRPIPEGNSFTAWVIEAKELRAERDALRAQLRAQLAEVPLVAAVREKLAEAEKRGMERALKIAREIVGNKKWSNQTDYATLIDMAIRAAMGER